MRSFLVVLTLAACRTGHQMPPEDPPQSPPPLQIVRSQNYWFCMRGESGICVAHRDTCLNLPGVTDSDCMSYGTIACLPNIDLVQRADSELCSPSFDTCLERERAMRYSTDRKVTGACFLRRTVERSPRFWCIDYSGQRKGCSRDRTDCEAIAVEAAKYVAGKFECMASDHANCFVAREQSGLLGEQCWADMSDCETQFAQAKERPRTQCRIEM